MTRRTHTKCIIAFSCIRHSYKYVAVKAEIIIKRRALTEGYQREIIEELRREDGLRRPAIPGIHTLS